MNVLDSLYSWTDVIAFWGLMAMRVWALGDCLIRKGAAFPAVDKLTKPAWATILLICALFAYLIQPPVGPISLITAVVSGIYLADVRPAVREISGG